MAKSYNQIKFTMANGEERIAMLNDNLRCKKRDWEGKIIELLDNEYSASINLGWMLQTVKGYSMIIKMELL